MLLTDELEDCGFSVAQASSYADAAHVLEHRSDLGAVLTDIDLDDEEDGLGLGHWLLEHRPDVMVMFMSGRRDAQQKVELLCRGARFFSKPVRASVVVEALMERFRIKPGEAPEQ
jgi:FixJ family two-component response regulator